jgi:acetoin utilization deacetylase AcuC-like enzyme
MTPVSGRFPPPRFMIRKEARAVATLLLHHSMFANHQTSAGHPERPDRYRAVEAVLGQSQFDALVREKAEVADLATTRYVHTNRYVDALEAARPNEGHVYLDGGDTMMDPSTWEVVLRGVGGTLQAVDKVLAKAACNDATDVE